MLLYFLELFEVEVLRRVKKFKIYNFIEKIDVWIKKNNWLFGLIYCFEKMGF